jgi:hypothetical protein
MGLKNVRDLAKRERQYFARNDLQACIVCGRYFTRARADRICSRDCLEKSQQPAGQGPGETPGGLR